NGLPPQAVVALAASVEQRSEHPIGRAVVEYAEQHGIQATPGARVQALEGRGAEGEVGGARVLLGNHRLFEERHLRSAGLPELLEPIAASGRTAVLVARDNEAVGLIAVADEPRKTGRDAVDLLRRQGIQAVVLLTGDAVAPAEAVARSFAVD